MGWFPPAVIKMPLDKMVLIKMSSDIILFKMPPMEQRTLKNASNYLNTNICSCSEISGGQSFNLYLHVVHFFNTSPN